MKRTLLAFGVGAVVCVPAVVLGEALGLGSWGFTLLGLGVILLVSLIDREGFYGVRRE